MFCVTIKGKTGCEIFPEISKWHPHLSQRIPVLPKDIIQSVHLSRPPGKFTMEKEQGQSVVLRPALFDNYIVKRL